MWYDPEVFCGHSKADIRLALEGKKVKSFSRKGKYFWLCADDEGPACMFHFGMTGHVIVRDYGHPYTELSSKDQHIWPPRFTKLEMHMDDGTQVAFTDARRCASHHHWHVIGKLVLPLMS